MIEGQEPTNGEVVKQETPAKITTSMIVEDLENGIDRPGIQEKYGLEKWMVTLMFQDPRLKGKKAKKVRKLPFEFVDDMEENPNQTEIPIEDAVEVEFTEVTSFDDEENEINN
jgi:hypothetical protein